MRTSGAIFMILLALVALGAAAYFGLTSSPWEPSGRGGAPAIILSCLGLIVGIILIVFFGGVGTGDSISHLR